MDKYDYSKFLKFGVTEDDIKFDIVHRSTCGNANFENNNSEVIARIKMYGLSVGCSTEKSAFKNRDKALDLLYLMLQEEFKSKNNNLSKIIGELEDINGIKRYYLHRTATYGELELNIEFNNGTADKILEESDIKEISECAIWE